MGHWLAAFHSWFEFDFAGRADGIFSQPVRKPSHDLDPIDLPVRQKQQPERYDALDSSAPSLAGVRRIRLGNDFGLRVDFLRGESHGIAFFEKKRKCAVSRAAIVLVFLCSNLRSRRQRWRWRRQRRHFRSRSRRWSCFIPPAGLSEGRCTKDENEDKRYDQL